MNPLETDQRLLTCVTPKGVCLPLLRRLSDELGIVSASVHSARGVSGSDPTGVFNRVEKDVLTVVVPASRADHVFEWLYREADVSGSRGRFLYLGRLVGATAFSLPEGVPQEHE